MECRHHGKWYGFTELKKNLKAKKEKKLLKSLGIEGDYEGIGNCILGYADGEAPLAKPRKNNFVYWVK